MNIIVCIKQVPDTNEVKLDPVTGTLIREGIPSIINPDDKAGLEAALRIKDENGAKVTFAFDSDLLRIADVNQAEMLGNLRADLCGIAVDRLTPVRTWMSRMATSA